MHGITCVWELYNQQVRSLQIPGRSESETVLHTKCWYISHFLTMRKSVQDDSAAHSMYTAHFMHVPVQSDSIHLSVSVPHQQSLPHREVCIESSTKFVCVCQARIQFAINHGPMDIMVQQLDAASETARLHCQLLHHLLDSLVLLLLKLYQTCANLPDILLRQVHADNITASSLQKLRELARTSMSL